MSGKNKFRILKEIRQKIADENDIPYVTHECRFRGDCSGTCPRCESELAYLERQLAARAAAGKRIAVAALCAGMTLSMAGCASPFSQRNSGDLSDIAGYMEPVDRIDDVFTTTGEIAPPEDLPETGEALPPEITGRTGAPAPSDNTEEFELMGDIAYVEENTGK